MNFKEFLKYSIGGVFVIFISLAIFYFIVFISVSNKIDPFSNPPLINQIIFTILFLPLAITIYLKIKLSNILFVYFLSIIYQFVIGTLILYLINKNKNKKEKNK